MGFVRIFNRNDDPFFDFLKANFPSLAPIILGEIVSFLVVMFITNFYKNEVMYMLKEKLAIQEELG